MNRSLPNVKNTLIYFPLLFVLASCGGGGGESNTSFSGNQKPGQPPLPSSAPGGGAAPARISRATPRPGSVTQSSNTENGITNDKIQIVNSKYGSFKLTKNDKTMIDYKWVGYPNNNNTYRGYGTSQDFNFHGVKGQNYWEKYTFDKGSSNSDYEDRYGLTARNFSYNEIDNNLTALEVYVDKRYIGPIENYPYGYGGGALEMVLDPENHPYLVLGYWAETHPQKNVTNKLLHNGELGVFVVSSHEYPNTISHLTGTARYQGPIKLLGYNTNPDYIIQEACNSACNNELKEQIISNLDLRRRHDANLNHKLAYNTGDMYGDIELNVNFGNSSIPGNIKGIIKNIESYKPDYSYINTSNYAPIYGYPNINLVDIPGSLNLERTDIGESHSGFFKGNVSGTLDGRNYEGKWGGQFYPNGDPNNIEHITVGGTMAVSSGDFHIIAPWSVNHEDR